MSTPLPFKCETWLDEDDWNYEWRFTVIPICVSTILIGQAIVDPVSAPPQVHMSVSPNRPHPCQLMNGSRCELSYQVSPGVQVGGYHVAICHQHPKRTAEFTDVLPK
jgi:hypothetical protein